MVYMSSRGLTLFEVIASVLLVSIIFYYVMQFYDVKNDALLKEHVYSKMTSELTYCIESMLRDYNEDPTSFTLLYGTSGQRFKETVEIDGSNKIVLDRGVTLVGATDIRKLSCSVEYRGRLLEAYYYAYE